MIGLALLAAGAGSFAFLVTYAGVRGLKLAFEPLEDERRRWCPECRFLVEPGNSNRFVEAGVRGKYRCRALGQSPDPQHDYNRDGLCKAWKSKEGSV